MMMFYKNLKDLVVAFILFVSFVYVSGDVSCNELPVITNGQLRLEGKNVPFNVNDSIPYVCDEDYRTDEAYPKVFCVLRDNVANWTKGECKQITRSCHDPGYIENANRVGNLFTFPHNITYVCYEGYRMVGIATKYCSKSGRWQPIGNPSCEAILCPVLSHPTNGEVLPTNRRPKDFANYKCDKNYKLVGESTRECLEDGTWSGSNPTCEEITCVAPNELLNGRIIGKPNVTLYNASDIIIFQCYDGRHISSKCKDNGEWSVRPPTCAGTTVIKPVKPVVETTTVTSEDHVTNEIKVEISFCEDPGVIKNGNRTFDGLHINSTMTYTCDEGYQLKGKSTLLCLENGKWDLNKLPICVKPLSAPSIVGIVFGVIFVVCVIIGGYLWYRYREKRIRGYGEKSKALTADATDIEEIAGLEREKKHIPVTVL